jgi:hypothetical protein
MKKDVKKTDVVFRKFTDDNSIIALFPYDFWGWGKIECMSYMHVGQHGAAEYSACVKNSVPVSEEEYKPLFTEWDSLGYNLRVIKRRNYPKWLKGYYENKKA